jgi:hypothetical protein
VTIVTSAAKQCCGTGSVSVSAENTYETQPDRAVARGEKGS